MQDIFEWSRVLTNDLPFSFLLEVIFRSTVMFLVLLITLRMTGKRGVRQLSVFETVIIIALGSAAGDPMFYEDVGIIPAITVFVVILLLYRLVTFIVGKSKRFEIFLEGKTECLIDKGQFAIHAFEKESLAQDEFFTELRLFQIEHLGQVRHAFLETTGDVSVYFYADDEVRYGLPILPQLFSQKSKVIDTAGVQACTFCGQTEQLEPGTATCTHCGRSEWVKAIKTRRVT